MRTPLLRLPMRRRGLRQAREPPAHRLVQVPRRVQRARVDAVRRDRARRRRRFERESRAGRRRRCRAARRAGHDRDAGERRARQGRAHRGASAPRSCAAPTRARSGSAWRPRSATRARSSTSHRSTTRGSSPARARSGSRSRATCPRVATVVVCVGGGGLISGVSTAVRALVPGRPRDRGRAGARRRRPGVAPRGPHRHVARSRRDADDLRRRPHAGTRRADVRHDRGARRRDRDRPEEAVLEAMRWLALEAKLLVEPTAALTLAALRTGAVATDGRWCSWCRAETSTRRRPRRCSPATP